MVAGSRKKIARNERRLDNLAAASAAASGRAMGVPVPTGVQGPVVHGRNSMPIGTAVRPPHPTARPAPVVEAQQPYYETRSVAPQIVPEQVIRRPEDPHPAQGEYGYARNSTAEEAIVPSRSPMPDVEHVLRPQEEAVTAPLVDVTVILYSNGTSSRHLAVQVAALRAQTVRPVNLWIHVDGQNGHDEKTAAQLHWCRTQMMLGRYHRMALARQASTRFVAILDEDTIPGRRWLERSLQELVNADPMGQIRYGGAVISPSGGLLMGDDPASARAVGPEFPTHDTLLVDFGRQAWVFDQSFCHAFDSLPEHKGGGALAFAFAMAAAASAARVATVVLDYGPERSEWPAREPSVVVDPFEDVMVSYRHYRTWWQPQFVGLAVAGAASPQPPAPVSAPAAPMAPPPAMPPAAPPIPSSAMPPAAPPLVVPPQAMAPAPPRGAVAQAIAAHTTGQPVRAAAGPTTHPDGRPAGRTPVPPPDAKVTSDGDMTTVEWVLPKEQQTADGAHERVLAPHERTPEQQNERVLAPHEMHDDRVPEQVIGHGKPSAQELVSDGQGGPSQP